MAHVQLCIHCGTDLARLRQDQQREDGLRFRHCPTCQRCVTVVRPEALKWMKSVRRIDLAGGILATQCIVFAGFTIATLIAMGIIGDALVRSGLEFSRSDALLFGAVGLVLPIFLGIWFGLGLGHLALLRVLTGWMLWLTVLIATMLAITYAFQLVDAWLFDRRRGERSFIKEIGRPQLIGFFIYLPLQVAVAMLGYPIGRGLRWTTGQLVSFGRTLQRRRRHRWRTQS